MDQPRLTLSSLQYRLLLRARHSLPPTILKVLGTIYSVTEQLRMFFKYGDWHHFRGVAIETATACNRACPYCPNSKFGSENKYMQRDVYNQIISRLIDIHFTGTLYFHFYNEPLLDDRLPELVQYAKNKLPKCPIRIFTNGDRLNTNSLEQLLKAGTSQFVVSCHDKDKTKFDQRMAPIVAEGRGIVELFYPHENQLSNRGGLVIPTRQENRNKCVEPLRVLQIEYTGKVILCCNDFNRTHAFGNILDQDIESIWHKPSFARLRKELRNGHTSLEMCRKCLCKYS